MIPESLYIFASVLCMIIFSFFMFWIGINYKNMTIGQKQADCEHSFKLYRVCKKCNLRQRELISGDKL